jgi:hypothetical protein
MEFSFELEWKAKWEAIIEKVPWLFLKIMHVPKLCEHGNHNIVLPCPSASSLNSNFLWWHEYIKEIHKKKFESSNWSNSNVFHAK